MKRSVVLRMTDDISIHSPSRHVLEETELFVFDFDGVLADSVGIKTAAFAEMYRPYGEDIVQQVVAYHVNHGGVSRFDKIKHYHQVLLGETLSEADVDRMAEYFSALVLKKVISSEEIPGSERFLKWLSTRGKCCAINSATPQDEMQRIAAARGLAKYFFMILGSPKSKVENLQTIMDVSGISPKRTLFFGDALSDAKAADACGVGFVGVGIDSYPLVRDSGKRGFHISNFLELLPD